MLNLTAKAGDRARIEITPYIKFSTEVPWAIVAYIIFALLDISNVVTLLHIRTHIHYCLTTFNFRILGDRPSSSERNREGGDRDGGHRSSRHGDRERDQRGGGGQRSRNRLSEKQRDKFEDMLKNLYPDRNPLAEAMVSFRILLWIGYLGFLLF
jgi:hypothetical protein